MGGTRVEGAAEAEAVLDEGGVLTVGTSEVAAVRLEVQRTAVGLLELVATIVDPLATLEQPADRRGLAPMVADFVEAELAVGVGCCEAPGGCMEDCLARRAGTTVSAGACEGPLVTGLLVTRFLVAAAAVVEGDTAAAVIRAAGCAAAAVAAVAAVARVDCTGVGGIWATGFPAVAAWAVGAAAAEAAILAAG